MTTAAPSRPALLLCAALLGLGAAPAAAQAGKLAELARSLAPGRWATLNVSGDGSGFDPALLCAEVKTGERRCGDNILNYASEGQWNALRGEAHFIGSGHLRETRHIFYTEASNTWAIEANPPWNCAAQPGCAQPISIGHNYDAVAMNPATGDLHARLAGYSASKVHRWQRASKSWRELPATPPTAYTMALEYFPEMRGLVLMGGGHVYLLRDGAAAWVSLAEGLAMGSYSTVASYNPVHRTILFGGGENDQGDKSSALYKLDAQGAVVPVAPAPEPIGVQLSQWVFDPVTARHLLWTRSGQFYDYDVTANAWRKLAVRLPTDPRRPVQWTAVIPVGPLSVVLLLAQHDVGDYRVHVYKHALGVR